MRFFQRLGREGLPVKFLALRKKSNNYKNIDFSLKLFIATPISILKVDNADIDKAQRNTHNAKERTMKQRTDKAFGTKRMDV